MASLPVLVVFHSILTPDIGCLHLFNCKLKIILLNTSNKLHQDYHIVHTYSQAMHIQQIAFLIWSLLSGTSLGRPVVFDKDVPTLVKREGKLCLSP